MQSKFSDKNDDHLSVDQWIQACIEEGRRIDANTAEVICRYVKTLDPYGLGFEIPEEYQCNSKEPFARSPGSNTWVWFGHLPTETLDRLLTRRPAEELRSSDSFEEAQDWMPLEWPLDLEEDCI